MRGMARVYLVFAAALFEPNRRYFNGEAVFVRPVPSAAAYKRFRLFR